MDDECELPISVSDARDDEDQKALQLRKQRKAEGRLAAKAALIFDAVKSIIVGACLVTSCVPVSPTDVTLELCRITLLQAAVEINSKRDCKYFSNVFTLSASVEQKVRQSRAASTDGSLNSQFLEYGAAFWKVMSFRGDAIAKIRGSRDGTAVVQVKQSMAIQFGIGMSEKHRSVAEKADAGKALEALESGGDIKTVARMCQSIVFSSFVNVLTVYSSQVPFLQ